MRRRFVDNVLLQVTRNLLPTVRDSLLRLCVQEKKTSLLRRSAHQKSTTLGKNKVPSEVIPEQRAPPGDNFSSRLTAASVALTNDGENTLSPFAGIAIIEYGNNFPSPNILPSSWYPTVDSNLTEAV